MPSPSLSLLWKEWRERRGSLAFFALGFLACALYVAIDARCYAHRTPVARYFEISEFFSLLAAVFLAMRTSLGELTDRSLGFSLALPVSSRRFAWHRLAGALVALTGPILLGAALLSLLLSIGYLEQAPPCPKLTSPGNVACRPSLPPALALALLWQTTAIVVAQAAELLLILSAIGARRRTEAQVGFAGAFLGVLWLLLCETHHLARQFEQPPALDWLAVVIPQSLANGYGYGDGHGIFTDLSIAGRVWGPLSLNVLVLLGLGFVFSIRYGTRRILPAESPDGWPRWRFPDLLPYLLNRLPNCCPGPIGSLVWLNLRRSLPIATAGLALAYLSTAVQLVLFGPKSDAPLFLAVAGHLPATIVPLAMLWGPIIAAALFAPELQPGLESFWRSRPIAPRSWFWTKFLTGLAVTLGILDGVTIIASWNSPYARYPRSHQRFLHRLPAGSARASLFSRRLCRMPAPPAVCRRTGGAGRVHPGFGHRQRDPGHPPTRSICRVRPVIELRTDRRPRPSDRRLPAHLRQSGRARRGGCRACGAADRAARARPRIVPRSRVRSRDRSGQRIGVGKFSLRVDHDGRDDGRDRHHLPDRPNPRRHAPQRRRLPDPGGRRRRHE
jgi:ABC-type transport system involved in multi-copper enzyme maturation permease subunit